MKFQHSVSIAILLTAVGVFLIFLSISEAINRNPCSKAHVYSDSPAEIKQGVIYDGNCQPTITGIPATIPPPTPTTIPTYIPPSTSMPINNVQCQSGFVTCGQLDSKIAIQVDTNRCTLTGKWCGLPINITWNAPHKGFMYVIGRAYNDTFWWVAGTGSSISGSQRMTTIKDGAFGEYNQGISAIAFACISSNRYAPTDIKSSNPVSCDFYSPEVQFDTPSG